MLEQEVLTLGGGRHRIAGGSSIRGDRGSHWSGRRSGGSGGLRLIETEGSAVSPRNIRCIGNPPVEGLEVSERRVFERHMSAGTGVTLIGAALSFASKRHA